MDEVMIGQRGELLPGLFSQGTFSHDAMLEDSAIDWQVGARMV
jgi:hypothetical protein